MSSPVGPTPGASSSRPGTKTRSSQTKRSSTSEGRTTNAERPCDGRNLIPKKLSLYITDGRYRMDNLVENSIRPLAIGRKNYLFCGDDDAAQRAAVVYSLLATCKAHGVEERSWLEDVFRRMPEYELGKKDFSDLLLGNWSAAGVE